MGDYREISEQELVDKIIEGDKKAIEILFSRFGGQISFKVGRRIGEENPDAEDLVQDIREAVFDSILAKKFDASKGALGNYIHGIATYRINQYLRRKTIESRVFAKGANPGDSEARIDKHLPRPKRPDEILESAAEKECLEAIIKKLKPEYKGIIYLKFYKELSIGEISERLGISVQKVSNLKSYALRLLRKKYDESCK